MSVLGSATNVGGRNGAQKTTVSDSTYREKYATDSKDQLPSSEIEKLENVVVAYTTEVGKKAQIAQLQI